MGFFNEKRRNIERVDKSYAYGIKPRNAEQAFALHAIQNPDINLVTICGVAGTGKTLPLLARWSRKIATTKSSSPAQLWH